MRSNTGRISRPVNRRRSGKIPDESPRSQYGFSGKVNEKTGEMSYCFASNLRDTLPDASFNGFTGTAIEKTAANTRAVLLVADSGLSCAESCVLLCPRPTRRLPRRLLVLQHLPLNAR